MTGHKLLSFMDAYSGYNQIKMHPPDEDKTTFITSQGIYCYKMMPFGLKNVGATFQRMINKVFKDLIENIMEVYMNDMLVKSVQRIDHLQDISKAFDLLRQYEVKLNPDKCTFEVAFRKFLGYLVTPWGIKVDPDQISAILNMKSPAGVKEVQVLNGRLLALNRFISRSTDKCRPLFLALKKNGADFCWNEECETTFQKLRRYLISPPCYRNPLQDRQCIFTSLFQSQQ